LTVQPNFSLYENTQTDDPTRLTLAQISQSFGPTGAMHFVATRDPAQNGADLKHAQDILSRHVPDNLDIFSLADVADDTAQMPDALLRRSLSEDGTQALLTVAYPYENAAATRDLALRIRQGIATDADADGLLQATPRGLEVMTSFVSADMLRDLNLCFLAAVVISGLLIAVWLRDPVAGLVALVPNVLPIALVGAWLVLSGRGLEFASGIALTIAFGLAIDDTLHVLNRLRLNLGGTIWAGRDAVYAAVKSVLPALVITSAVLSFGMMGTFAASLPSLAYFGALSIAVFVLALLADIIVLPACINTLSNFRKRRGAS
jgi:predicted RND superfamily exporter protein